MRKNSMLSSLVFSLAWTGQAWTAHCVPVNGLVYSCKNDQATVMGIDDATAQDQADFTIQSTITLGETCYKVTAIGRHAFKGNTTISQITLPASINRIAPGAFYQCSQLTQVHFQENSQLQLIGHQAFYESGLTSIILPKTLKYIGQHAFESCSALTRVEVAEDCALEAIGSKAFCETMIKSIIIPAKVRYIGQEAFAWTKLRQVTFLKNSPIKFGAEAFNCGGPQPDSRVKDLISYSYVPDWLVGCGNRPLVVINLDRNLSVSDIRGIFGTRPVTATYAL